MDAKLTYKEHTINICKKATNIYKQIARVLKISWGLNPEITRTIYLAIIEPIVLYAASVWHKVTDKITTKKKLLAVQRRFAQIIARTYKTVSLNAATLMAGLLPMDLRINEAAQLYEIKRGRPWTEIADRNVERKVNYLEAPHPGKITKIEYKLKDEETEDELKEYISIFTDGSKIEGKVGAALSVWGGGEEIKREKIKLDDFCTVFQAELYAIYRATKLAACYEKTNIISDSRSALDIIANQDDFHPISIRN